MNWNKKHEEFALSVNLSESEQLVFRDILRKSNKHEASEIEIDLRKTNRWIGKQRIFGEYHRKTMTRSIPALEEKGEGMVTILKRYSPWVYKILVRPLSFLARIQSAKCESSRNLTTVNPMFDAEHKKRVIEQQQQDMSTLRDLFAKLGMHYTDDAICRLWRMAGKKVSEVKNAVEFMLKSHAEHRQGGIPKPHGWLHECLKHGWHRALPDCIQVMNLPLLNETGIAQFLSGQLPEEIVNYAREMTSDRREKWKVQSET